MSGQANLIALSKESPSEDEWFVQIRNYSWYPRPIEMLLGRRMEQILKRKIDCVCFLSRAVQ